MKITQTKSWMAVLALSLAPLKGVTITNLTTNTVLFSDNFENGSFSPSVGSWSIVGPDVTVTNAASPGAAQGSFYAQLFRDQQFLNGQGNLQAQLSAAQTNPGDVIRLSMMILLPDDGTAARGQFMLDDGDFGSARAWVQTNGAGHVLAIGPGFASVDTGLLYTPGVWQEWDLQYAIGDTTFSVAVNGVSASGFASATSGSLGFADIFNGAFNPAGSFYLDAVPPAQTAVPEPGSFLLGGAALTILTSFGRRSRH